MNVIVLGGTHDHIKLIKLLKRKKYTVYLIDYYEFPIAKKYADFHIVGSTLDKEFVLEKCIELNVEFCIAFCIDQALLTMAFVSEKLNLPCHINYETALKLTNKVHMKNVFINNDIPTSNFLTFKSKYSDKFNIDNLNFPVVVKPADSNSSKGISKVHDIKDFFSAYNFAYEMSNTKEVVVEEFIDGEELSIDVIIIDFQPSFILITKNIKRKDSPNKFTIIKNVFSLDTHNKFYNKIKSIVIKIAMAYNLKNTPLLVQAIVNKGDIYVIEFSARIGGGSKHQLVKALTNINMIDNFFKIIEKNEPLIVNKFNYKYAVVNYIYSNEGIINKYWGLKNLINKNIIDKVFKYKSIKTKINSSASSTDRPIGVLILSHTVEDLIFRTKEFDCNFKILNKENIDIMIHNLYD